MEGLNPAAAAAAAPFCAAAESVEKFGISITVLGKVGVTVETASMVTSGSAPPAWRGGEASGGGAGEVHGGEDEGRPPVGGGADFEEAQRVRHHGRGQDLLDGHLLAVARVGV